MVIYTILCLVQVLCAVAVLHTSIICIILLKLAVVSEFNLANCVNLAEIASFLPFRRVEFTLHDTSLMDSKTGSSSYRLDISVSGPRV